jgi:hypothetical protein
MIGESKLRQLRAMVRNAVVWGVAWGAAAFVTILTLRTIGVMVPAHIRWYDALGMAIRFGVVGGLAGVAFASAIRFFYRGKRLSDISLMRFTIGGALLGGVGVPLLMETMSVLTGGGLVPWSLIQTDALFAGLFGGLAAGGSLKLAQLADAREIDRPRAVDELAPGMNASAGAKQRSRESIR